MLSSPIVRPEYPLLGALSRMTMPLRVVLLLTIGVVTGFGLSIGRPVQAER